jgi:hypothetical protein
MSDTWHADQMSGDPPPAAGAPVPSDPADPPDTSDGASAALALGVVAWVCLASLGLLMGYANSDEGSRLDWGMWGVVAVWVLLLTALVCSVGGVVRSHDVMAGARSTGAGRDKAQGARVLSMLSLIVSVIFALLAAFATYLEMSLADEHQAIFGL